jgi:uncharacterized protein YjbI with pentapeptide repeats
MKINSYLLIALLLAVSIALIVFIPRWQEENYRTTINTDDIARLEPKDRVQLQKDLALVENSFRATLAQIIGGSLLLLSLYLTYRNVKIAQENARIANENLRVVEEGKLTDRFSKAVELLVDEKLEARLGGIYALERIAQDSQKDHWTIVEILTAFVRQNSKSKPKSENEAELQSSEPERIKLIGHQDIQAVLTVIGRRKWIETEGKNKLLLVYVDLSKVDLYEANLSRAYMFFADLSKAYLNGADFRFTLLQDANLSGAYLRRTNLSYADLSGANLSSALLTDADLSFANLENADLNSADFERANLNNARLKDANLTKVKNLTLIQLLSAKDYYDAKLTKELKTELEAYLNVRDQKGS